MVNAALDLLIDNEAGIWHLTNDGEISWADLGRTACRKANLNSDIIDGRLLRKLNWIAPRPYYSALKSDKGIVLPSLDDALNRYFYEKNIVPLELESLNKHLG